MYNEEMVKITFVVPLSVKERLKRYAKYTNFSMTDIFRTLVNELSVDPYMTNHAQIEQATLKTQLFLGKEKPISVIKEDGLGVKH